MRSLIRPAFSSAKRLRTVGQRKAMLGAIGLSSARSPLSARISTTPEAGWGAPVDAILEARPRMLEIEPSAAPFGGKMHAAAIAHWHERRDRAERVARREVHRDGGVAERELLTVVGDQVAFGLARQPRAARPGAPSVKAPAPPPP